MVLLAVSLLALAEMTVYVYKKDGTKVPYVASTVDSIGFVDVTPPEAVDLGLPSGTKWANMNVGANKPEDFGDYFAWGETTAKSDYSWSTYKWCEGSLDTQTKYCTDSDYGTVDNKTTLDLSDDAAHVNWGTSWRMPTKAELNELEDNCTWTRTTLNGVKGCIVTSKTNGNSIFLPAAGSRSNSGLDYVGSNGYYWSSSVSTSHSDDAYDLWFFFNSVHMGIASGRRYSGLSVRPVLADVHTITFNANGGTGSMDMLRVKEGENVTLPANSFSKVDANFIGWNTKLDGSGTAYADKSTVKPTANITLYAQWEAPKDTGIADGHEWVDLGLPSGTKWATMNVGASSPEDYGDYFAWGEITTKSSYNWSTYKWCEGSDDTMTKYCTSSSYGTVDNKTTLDLSDDAAHVNWGTSWRMPTQAEQDELRNTSYTTWTWTTQNGVKGYKVTSKTNGNSIFLPAAGYRYDSDLDSAGPRGIYWGSSLFTYDSDGAYYLRFSSNFVDSGYYYRHGSRYLGQSVRPVLRE